MSFDRVQRIKVDGIELAFREAGSGEPLLLVHGWPLSSLTWRKVVPALAEGWRCIAPDLAGAGESLGPVASGLGLGAQAQRLAGLLDALGVERATVIGHDSGGSVARSFAVLHPERVARLVLADTEVPGHRPLFVVTLKLTTRLPGGTALIRRVLRTEALAKSPLGFALCFGDLGRFDFGEFFETLVAPTVRSEEAVRGTLRFLREFDFREVDALEDRYTSLAMPKCVIWGGRDLIFPEKQGRRLFEMLPEPKRFERVPDAGLFVHEEQPDEWVRIVRSFLAETA